MATNPWLERRVIAYAHQGGAREAPSSTLYAIARAVAAGAPAVELDVHATADRKLVVCHDPTLERTTNATGEIRHRTLSELKELDNAYFFVEGEDAKAGLPEEAYSLRGRAPAEADLGIASLPEVLEAFPGVVLNLDIKRTAPEVEPYEQLLAEVLRAYDRRDDVIVASFNDQATAAFSGFAPEIPTSAGTVATAQFYFAARAGEEAPESVRHHVALQVPAVHGEITVVDRPFVEAAHKAGLAVHVWTIDDQDEMGRLIDLGVDGIISDRPSLLVKVLKEKDLYWRT
jgi:glycerophosphoryl diester phosphodiesterase